MRKIGEILKSEREKKDLSLHEIGMSLKINPKILKAIEESDEKNLPAKTFLRGFIRKTEREKKDLSLHEIGMSLKINPKILKAIEESDEKNLPAKTFLRGFIRSYA